MGQNISIFEYSGRMQEAFRRTMNEYGYTVITTFYGDLSIADLFGPDAVRDTYRRVCRDWLDNVQYFTEFVMCLNHKIWEHYDENAESNEMAAVYDELWRAGDDLAREHYHGEDLDYYYQTTD